MGVVTMILNRIKKEEGFRAKAEPDPIATGNPLTIGYGHTGPDVYAGQTITEEDADTLLRKDLSRRAGELAARLGERTLPDNQFAALLSLAFNIGVPKLLRSTLLKKHAAGDTKGAAAEFSKWVYSGKHKREGLVKRREWEASLYTKSDQSTSKTASPSS